MKKATNALMIVQAVLMYLQVPILILFMLPNDGMDPDTQSVVAKALFSSFFALMGLAVTICLVNILLAFISAFKSKSNPSKITMIIKIILIPWFSFNFVFCVLLTAVFFNPFLFMAIPLAIALMMFVAYVYMIATSAYDIAFFINRLVRKQIKQKAPLIVATVFLFIFCLDIVGSIIFFKKSSYLS